ncbi:choice-of-anchor Q domain-containing protein, partial [Chloroflexota bacterium]
LLTIGIVNLTPPTVYAADCPAPLNGAAITGTVTITLTADCTLSDEVTIDGDVTINGNGHTIYAVGADATTLGSKRHFYVAGATLTLNNVTLIGGNGMGTPPTSPGPPIRGGSIYNAAGTVTIINNSTLSSNKADVGGAVYNDGGEVVVTDSAISGNEANSAGAIGNNPASKLHITNSVINGNRAQMAGGAIYNKGEVIVTGSSFSGNEAGSGGTIYNDFDTVRVTDSTFSANRASRGGAIANGSNLIVINSTFNSNIAYDLGGAIRSYNGTTTVTGSTFNGNTASSSGGAIANSGGNRTNNVSFNNGVPPSYNSDLIVSNSVFSGNRAGSGGAIANDIDTDTNNPAKFNGVDGVITRASFPNGGTVVITNGNVTVTNSTFSDNIANNGGAIANGGIVFIDNDILADSRMLADASNLSSSRAFAKRHTSSNEVDQIEAVNSANTLTVSNSTFRGNTANSFSDGGIGGFSGFSGFGGAIYGYTGTVSVTNCTFSSNTADTDGGALANGVSGGYTRGSSDLFVNGGPPANGAITEMFVMHSTFSDNEVVGGGIIPSTFSGEVAGRGSTIYNGFGQIHITNSLVTNGMPQNCHNEVGTFTAAGANISSDDSCPGFSMPNTNPKLAGLASNGGPTQTMALIAGSPAIDAVMPCPLSADQRGVYRLESTCDSGAYEWVRPESVVPFGDPVDCDAISSVSNESFFVEGTPESTAYTVPLPEDLPAGYAYVAQPYYTGYCDVFAPSLTREQIQDALPLLVCWPSSSGVVVGLYHDLPDLSRTWTILPMSPQGDDMCTSLPMLGGVALLSGGSVVVGDQPVAPTNNVVPAQTVVDCQVTMTHTIRFRATPGGEEVSRVPYETTLHATAESDGWYQVVWGDQTGWVSADFVTAVCQ